MIYSVSLRSTVNFTKDIFIFDQNTIVTYLTSAQATVCGDDICSFGETLITCPADCFADAFVDGVNVSLKDTDSPCGSDSECRSNNCEYNVCTLQGTNQACVSDSQCLSGSCDNSGVCTKPNLEDRLIASKNQSFGDGDNSNLILCGMIIIGFIVVIMIGTRNAPALGFIISLLVTLILIIIFTAIGWLPVFYLILIFFCLIVLAMLGALVIVNFGGN